jgi:hypothetical protein
MNLQPAASYEPTKDAMRRFLMKASILRAVRWSVAGSVLVALLVGAPPARSAGIFIPHKLSLMEAKSPRIRIVPDCRDCVSIEEFDLYSQIIDLDGLKVTSSRLVLMSERGAVLASVVDPFGGYGTTESSRSASGVVAGNLRRVVAGFAEESYMAVLKVNEFYSNVVRFAIRPDLQVLSDHTGFCQGSLQVDQVVDFHGRPASNEVLVYYRNGTLEKVIDAALTPESETFSLHEPILAELSLQNRSQMPVQIDFGRNFQGNIRLVVNGASALPPQLPPEGGLSFPGEVEIKAGGSYSRLLLFNDWFHFEKPGRYEVRFVLESPPLHIEANATVTVGPRDPERLAKSCAKLAEQARSYEADPATRAAKALSFADDEACLPALAEVVRRSFHGKEGAILGLARLGTPQAIEVLVGEWDKLRVDQMEVAYGELERQGKLESLRAALLKAGKQLGRKDPW